MTPIRRILDDLRSFSLARRDQPELHIYPLAFYDIVRVPDYQNFYRPPEMGKDKRLVGYLFGMPMVLDTIKQKILFIWGTGLMGKGLV